MHGDPAGAGVLAALASASCAVRSSAISVSGCSAPGCPGDVHRGQDAGVGRPAAARRSSASASEARSSSSGRRAADGAAHLAQAVAGRCGGRVEVAARLRRGRGPGAWSAASSWVTMLVTPCASVSWISRASRCRSSSTPAWRAVRPAPRGSRSSASSASRRCSLCRCDGVDEQPDRPGQARRDQQVEPASQPLRQIRARQPTSRGHARRSGPAPTSRASRTSAGTGCRAGSRTRRAARPAAR